MRKVCGLLGLLWGGLAAGQPSAATMTRAEQEQFLATAKIANIRAVNGGITGTRKATLTLGSVTHDAHIQTIDESKMRFEGNRGTELNFRDTYKFNIAGYRLDKLLDLRMVPPSVARDVGGRQAAVTWWVDNVLMEEGERMKKHIPPPDGSTWNEEMYIVRVFDQLIRNTDRNVGNLLITKDWKLWMIDHSRAFRSHTEIETPKNLTRCDRALLASMKALDEATLKREMAGLLTDMEMKGLLKRRDQIVKIFEKMPPTALYSLERRQ